jgi:GNAT superfamily N-acetyltransferase
MTTSAKRVPTRADLPAIAALLTRANATPYDIARVAEEKVFGRGYAGEPQPRVCLENGDIVGIAVTCGEALRLLAVDPAHRRRGIATQLLGNERIVAAEPGNYFTPGVIESDAATRAFFRKQGYVEDRWTINLVTATRGNLAPAEPVHRAIGTARDRVLTFANDRFSPIWRFECENAGDNLFFIEHDGRIAGFAAHSANNRLLGTFGPTGVAPELRGRGYGRALLLAALADLARAGFDQAVIPWTDAIDFYRKSCGAEVVARFVRYVR